MLIRMSAPTVRILSPGDEFMWHGTAVSLPGLLEKKPE
jgi:hypothetical protein